VYCNEVGHCVTFSLGVCLLCTHLHYVICLLIANVNKSSAFAVNSRLCCGDKTTKVKSLGELMTVTHIVTWWFCRWFSYKDICGLL